MADFTTIPEGFKRCSSGENCIHADGPYLPATGEFFHHNKRMKGGLHGYCKACRCYQNQLYAQNHKKENIARAKKWHAEHPDRVKEIKKNYEIKHADIVRDRKRQWWLNNRPAAAVLSEKRRSKVRELPDTFTAEDWQYALEYFNGCCAVCGRPNGLWHKVVQDHWIPVRLSGGYTPDNIVPLCHGYGGCNNQKSGRHPTIWLEQKYGSSKAKQIGKRIEQYFAAVRDREAS